MSFEGEFANYEPLRRVLDSAKVKALQDRMYIRQQEGEDSIEGILTYKNAEDLRATAKALPLDRLLVETDAPFLAPIPFRGKPNEPSFVVKTLEQLAVVRGLTRDDMAKITSDNFFRHFSKVPRPASFA